MNLKKVLFAFIGILACLSISAQTINPKFIDGHLYFKFVDSYEIDFTVNENTSIDADQLPKFADLFNKYEVTLITRPLYCFNSEKLARIIRLEFNQAEKIEEFIKELELRPEVEYAEKIPLPKKLVTYNDPYYSASYLNGAPNQWYLNFINAPQAWDLQTGDPSIKIAIVDNAVWGAHEDLNISSSNMCSYANGTASVGNSAPPSSVSQSTTCSQSDIYNDGCPSYDWSHGTHCAGLVGAINNNNKGISSIGGGCTLMGIRGANNNGYMYYCDNGVAWAANNGAKIISMSWGSDESSSSEETLMQEVYENDIILIAAAGNDGDGENPIFYPAGYSSVISVASTNSDGKLSYFSQHGPGRADIAAPGGFYIISGQYASNILSTTYCTCQYWRLSGTSSLNGEYYDGMQGTSMACPVTSGLVGLMASAYPDITPDQVKACLISNATPLTSGSNTITNNAGYINAYASVQCAQTLAAGGTIPDVPGVDPGWYGNEEYTSLNMVNQGKMIIIRPETYGNYSTGNQVTKVKFGTYYHSDYPTYNNNSFTIKIYEGSNMNSELTNDGGTTDIASCLGNLVYTQNYTQSEAGVNIVDLNTPYTINSDTPFWIAIEANGPTLFLFTKENQSNAIDVDDYSSDFSVASGHYLYTSTDNNTDYLNINYGAQYTDNSQSYVIEYSREYVLAYYISDGSVYVPQSDFAIALYDANGNAYTNATINENESLYFTPILSNNGPDAASGADDCIALEVSVNGIVIDSYTTNSLDLGNFYIFGGGHADTITAAQFNNLGVTGTFDVCITVTYAGTDPNLNNNTSCITVTRISSTPSYTVTTTANPLTGGTLRGAGTYLSGASVTVVAEPNNNFEFVNWTENGNIVSTSDSYTFTINSNRNLVANFNVVTPDTYTVTITENPSNGGRTTGAGTYVAGLSVSINAIASSGFEFVEWTENGTVVSTNSHYTFTIDRNRDFEAHFRSTAPDVYTVTASVTPANSGRITGDGSYVAGLSVTVVAHANNGYEFLQWTENGNTVSTNSSYTFTINSNRNLVAHFNTAAPNTYSITSWVNGVGGSITPRGTISVNPNSNKTYTITPDNGYIIQTVKVDGVDAINDLINNAYTFYNITTDHTIVATFASTIGIEDNENQSLILYPNPNDGTFMIQTKSIGSNFTYQLFDAKGALLDHRRFDSSDETINLNYNLTAGLYFVRIISDKKSWTERVIVK
ncbi:MAG: S8 family peptidase [Bacteroidales bacterium]|nr:S8 family peptidase [Bacteroidales bacterium]